MGLLILFLTPRLAIHVFLSLLRPERSPKQTSAQCVKGCLLAERNWCCNYECN
uniref:Uncharacterized protein n=1 Tax=Rhizophora mucronata TaxID=61149 RepID=A0A2P2JW20_RHIMU